MWYVAKCALTLAIAPFSPAAVAQSQIEDIPQPILVRLNNETPTATRQEDLCSYHSGPTLAAGTQAILIGERSCRSTTRLHNAFQWEIAVNGTRLFVAWPSIKIPEADQERVDILSAERREQYFETAKILSLDLRGQELDKLGKAIATTRRFGLTIVKAFVSDVSEYTEGTSFGIKIYNPTDVPIKYVWITVVGLDPVNEAVRDPLKGGPALTVKAIGPIAKGESASYSWEYMWHTDIVKSFRIPTIRVQYIDNSTRTIHDWRAIVLSSEYGRMLE